MEKLTEQDGMSLDVVDKNLNTLKGLFPEAFSEDGINFEVLKQLLGGEVAEDDEKYGLNWFGKKKARQIALTPSVGTLRPCPTESVEWDTTQNLFIEGDNLEVLKLLQRGYAGKVKMIYIDPPYNTGKEFIYPDKFKDNLDTYLLYTGQKSDDGFKTTSNTETSGRYHTNWLNMLYPRLKLARSLLREDGVILVSLDDVEVSNAKKLLDEVFGEENFAATLVFDRNRKNDAKYFSVGHEYMLVYFKNEQYLSDNDVILRGDKEGVDEVRDLFDQLRKEHGEDFVKVREGLLKFYSTIGKADPRIPLTRFRKVDEKGPFRDDGNINWPGGGGPTYDVAHPTTGEMCKKPISGWRYPTPERFWEEVDKGRVVFGPDETTVPRVRTNLFENSNQVMVSVGYSYAQTSANEFSALFDGERVFDNPKPISDLAKLISYLCGPDDIVMDYFSGSATTAHAVMLENARKDVQRRFFMVQLPEKCAPKSNAYKLGYSTIADIGKDRVVRAAKKIQDDYPDAKKDFGFKVFKLDSSNIVAWNPDKTDLEKTLLTHAEHLVSERSEQDVLYELLLKRGVELTVPIEEKKVSGKTVYSIGYGALFACLDKKVQRDQIEELAQGIIDWHKELDPVSETQVVFRDSAFENDIAKTNITAILEQSGIKHVRSL
nr:site-specific DNA-methyltransferase [uncultured Pseudodesulfovibrio sp.]